MHTVLLLCSLFSVSLADSFWLSAELLRVDWREGCLTTAGCGQPRFKLLHDMLPINEKVSISWPVTEHFVQDSARPFVSHWPSGSPEDVTLSCQVVGTDPTYGFPRVCDQTASVRVFKEQIVEAYNDRLRSRRHPTTTPLPEEEQGRVLLEVRGKCFNATLAVQKHTERCPWCPDPKEITIIGNELPEEQSTFSASLLAQLQGEDRLLHVGLLVCAGIALVASTAFGCILVAFIRQRNNKKTRRPRFHPYQPTPALLKTDDENRYDLPWETQRPLHYWMSNGSAKSEGTTTSPLESTSSMYGYRTAGLGAQTTRLYHHISPNSSIHHDDSGLESV